MFDDPKLRLYELDEALKAAEMDDLAQELEEEEPDWLQDVKDILNESATEPLPIRNRANNYGREPAPRPVRESAPRPSRKPESADFPRMVYADEDMGESDAVYVEPPKRQGAGGLILLALLELIGIGLVILWWMKWTL